ncbi:MAG: Bax inhibitor-1/YccA family protein [Flavobacteriales bacterium]
MENTAYFTPVASLSDERRALFIKKTYANVAIAVLTFALLETFLLQSETIVRALLGMMGSNLSWFLLLGGFMFVTNYSQKMAMKATDRTTQYVALGIFVLAEAIIFVPLLTLAMIFMEESGTNVLAQAGIVTIGLFVGLSAIALFSKKDFSFLSKALTIGFFIALGLMIAGAIFGFNLGLWFSAGMVVLSAGSILYQTSNIVHEYHEEQYVAASLGLFASLMLLFWYILSIFMRD